MKSSLVPPKSSSALISPLDGIAYRQRAACASPDSVRDRLDSITCCENTRKSNVALLLPHLFPVTPLLHHSYKKIGGTPLCPALRSLSVGGPALRSFSVGGPLIPCAPAAPLLSPLDSTLLAKPYTNPPLSKPFGFNRFQTSCKAPLSNSFVLIALQNQAVFLDVKEEFS
jgi:hypothetical protein